MTARLLILDDESAVAETIAMLAEYSGHRAEWTSDPMEFLDLVRTWAPTHLALDLMMPEMDGIDVLGVLAEDGCTAEIILSSGVGGRLLEAARLFATENGLRIAGVLSKPFGAVALDTLLALPSSPPAQPSGGAPMASVVAAIGVAELAAALERPDGIEVAYQPKVACGSGRLTGFEALARWHHPDVGWVPPLHFVAIAEDNDLVEKLTDRVVSQALTWFAAEVRDELLTLAVNISPLSLADPKLVTRLTQHCANAGVDPSRVVLELTESRRTRDLAMSLKLLTRLRMHGFHLSLDDFGTGYSSMQRLAQLPFSEIKVDRSFVSEAATSEEARTVVKSVVDLGHGLGLTVTAEGVEDQETLDLLDALGTDLAQGYHVARPMPPDQAVAWAAARPRC